MKKIKRDYLLSILSGIILIFLGIFFQVTNLAKAIIPLIFINTGTILIVISVLTHNKFGAGITQDERTRTLSTRAIAYSWLLTFVLVNILFWFDYLKFVDFKVEQVLAITLFTMTLSAGILQSYFKHKGVINEN
jgi:predicted CDP-diglyceride synthetase/phosphatidate cytidylyltransferase